MARAKDQQEKKRNKVQAKKNQEERATGYGNKKLEGPDRPST